jgi:hypothetical protein
VLRLQWLLDPDPSMGSETQPRVWVTATNLVAITGAWFI